MSMDNKTNTCIALAYVNYSGNINFHRIDENNQLKPYEISFEYIWPESINLPNTSCWVELKYSSSKEYPFSRLIDLKQIDNPILELSKKATKMYDLKSIYPVREYYRHWLFHNYDKNVTQYFKEHSKEEQGSCRFEQLDDKLSENKTLILTERQLKWYHDYWQPLTLIGFMDDKYDFIPLEKCMFIRHFRVCRKKDKLCFVNDNISDKDIGQLLPDKLYVTD